MNPTIELLRQMARLAPAEMAHAETLASAVAGDVLTTFPQSTQHVKLAVVKAVAFLLLAGCETAECPGPSN